MPGDTKTHIARQGKKAKNRPDAGTIKDVQTVLWRAITRLAEKLERKRIPTDELTKLVHATSQAASTYARIVEVGELESRVEELEAAQANQGHRWAA